MSAPSLPPPTRLRTPQMPRRAFIPTTPRPARNPGALTCRNGGAGAEAPRGSPAGRVPLLGVALSGIGSDLRLVVPGPLSFFFRPQHVGRRAG